MDPDIGPGAASVTRIRWRSLGIAIFGLGLFVGSLWSAPPFPLGVIGMLIGGFLLGDGASQVLRREGDELS